MFPEGSVHFQAVQQEQDTCNLCGERTFGQQLSEQGLLCNEASLRHCRQMDALQDLQDVLDMEIHGGAADTAKKDMENSKQTSKVGNTFLQGAWSQPSLLINVPSTGAPNAH